MTYETPETSEILSQAIWGSYNGEDVDADLLGRNAVWTWRKISAFRGDILPAEN